MRAIVLGVAALALLAGAASAQAVYPSYGNGPPLYNYAGPAMAAPVHAAPEKAMYFNVQALLARDLEFLPI